MDLSNEDALRLNVLLASDVQAIRIDEATMTVYALTGRGEATVQLHPSGRPETYLRAVRELFSGHALGSPGGFPIYLRNWTRSGQPMGDNLDRLLLLGEPEAVVSVAYSPKVTAELARRAWWAMPVADNARRMLERESVAQSGMGKVLADFLIEHLPFEHDPHVIMDTVRIVLYPDLLDEPTRLRLWNKASRDNAYYVPFLERSPDHLPGQRPARADWNVMENALVGASNPYAQLLTRLLSPAGQVFLFALGEVLARPANRDVITAALNAMSAYFSAIRVADDAAAAQILAAIPALETELHAALALAQVDAEMLRPILSRTTAEGSLMRRKLEPVIQPVLQQLAALRGRQK